MKRYRHRRILLLFGALTLPSAAIAFLGWKLVAQDRELADTHFAAERKREIAELRQELDDRLAHIKDQVVFAKASVAPERSDPLVEFTAKVEENRLVLSRDRGIEHEKFVRSSIVLDQSSALREAYPTLRVTESEWRQFGDPPLLVGLATGGATAIVVRAPELFAAVAANRAARGILMQGRIVTGSVGDPLGEHYSDLRVVFDSHGETEVQESVNLHWAFYSLSLAAVVSVSLFGGYLVWRDTQREIRTSKLRSQFVSSVSHELRTPLTSIRMFAETLQMRGVSDPEMLEEYLETIIGESGRLTRLLDNVLDFARIERDERTYHMAPARLEEIVDDAVRAVKYPLSEQGFDLRLAVESGLPVVHADRDAIEQAVLNLLTNAMKYSGQSRLIELRLRSADGCVVIEVEDYGVGIAPDDHARIFSQFFRVRTEENRAISGAGLGLSLVAHIVKAHGGRIGVDSAPGRGSIFVIRLPVEQKEGA